MNVLYIRLAHGKSKLNTEPENMKKKQEHVEYSALVNGWHIRVVYFFFDIVHWHNISQGIQHVPSSKL